MRKGRQSGGEGPDLAQGVSQVGHTGKPFPLLLFQPSPKSLMFPNPPGQAHPLRSKREGLQDWDRGRLQLRAPEKEGKCVDGPGWVLVKAPT